jgi:hypothetical protein
MLPSGVTPLPSETNGTPANFKKKIIHLDIFMDVSLASSINRLWEKQMFKVQYLKANSEKHILMCIITGSTYSPVSAYPTQYMHADEMEQLKN